MKAQHTPGPWVAEHNGTGDAMIVCKCGWKNADGTKFEPVLIQRIGWEDARLIAGAPELLAALKDLYECGEHQTTVCCNEFVKCSYERAKTIIAHVETQA